MCIICERIGEIESPGRNLIYFFHLKKFSLEYSGAREVIFRFLCSFTTINLFSISISSPNEKFLPRRIQ
jgi:hypothetical protein